MMFTFRESFADQPRLQKKFRQQARVRLALYVVRPGELELERYLLNKYKLTLKGACLWLLMQSRFMTGQKGEATLLFVNKQADEIASIITYGTGRVKGSQILVKMFGGR